MVRAGTSIFGSIGWIEDMGTVIFGRLCSGSIQMGSSISGDNPWIDYR